MSKPLRPTLWERVTAFWDHLFLWGEKRFTASLHDLAQVFRYRSHRRSFSKLPLCLEALEPRWVLSPFAVNDSYSILHDQVLTKSSTATGVLGNDYDTGDLPLTVISNTNPSHGSLTLSSNGTFTYTPSSGYYGEDEFSYTISDGSYTDSASVLITVTDQAPVAVADSYSILHDHTLTVSSTAAGVLGNDYDPDGDSLTITSHTNPYNGSLTLNSDGTFTYTPSSGYTGSDAFSYTISDGVLSASASVVIEVTDQAPVANDDSYSVLHDHTLTVSSPSAGVLGNDTDADGDTLTITSHMNPSNGSLTLNSNGTFTYTPSSGYTGTDLFSYTVSDGALSASTSVAIDVTDQAPVANGDSYSVLHDHTLTVSSPSAGVLGNDTDADGDTLTVSSHTNPSNGSLTLSANGTFTYTPSSHFTGTDFFSYTVTDGALSASTSVYIDVTDQAPVAVADSYSVIHNHMLSVSSTGAGVLANDTDADGDSLTVTSHTNPYNGSLTLNSNGTFTYTPSSGYVGSDEFEYTVTDGVLNASTVVTINVTETAPVAVNDSYSVLQNHTLAVTSTGQGVLGNDTDADGDSLSVTGDSGPAHGTLTLNSDGTFSYVPSTGYVGVDSFTYTITDGFEYASANAFIDVGDAPVAVNDSYQIMQDQTLTVSTPARGLLANDVNDSAETLTVTSNSTPGHSSVSVNSDGTLTYTPATGYVGADSFTYVATTSLGSSNATVSLTVAGTPSITVTQSPTAAPTITPPSTQTNTEGDSVSVGFTATDPNSYTLSYDAVDLPPGLTINSASGAISGTVAAQTAEFSSGTYTVTLLAVDSHGASASAQFNWDINAASPTLTGVSNQSNLGGDSVSLQITASQYDSDPLDYEADNLPDGLSLDSDTGLISGTVAADAVSSTPYSVTVTVTDYTPATPSSASTTFNWSVAPGAASPALTNPGNQLNNTGDAVDVSLTASDPSGDPLTFTASGLPSGLVIDPGSGEITGTLPNAVASATAYNVTVTASDGQVSTSDSFTWTVGGVSLSTPADQTNLDGDTVSLALGATDATSTTLTYSAAALPSGLSLDSSTGVISGTLSATGTATMTVAASDGTYSDSQTFTWEVDPFAFPAPANQSNLEGSSVSVTLTATDNVGTPTFSISGLPSGVSLNAATGVLSGTLANNAHLNGPYQVTATAIDGSSTISQGFVWSVTPQLALVNPGAQGDAVGDTVSLAVIATDFAGGTPTFSLSGQPSGLTINAATGVISGTIGSDSPSLVTVSATDGTYSDSQTFSWNVSPLYLATPVDQMNLDDDGVSLSLAAAYHGGGTLSYSVTGLPDGLSFNTSTGSVTGTLTNTADADGPYSVTVTATDGTDSATVSFSWEVDPRVTVDAVDDQTNVTGDSVSLTLTSEEGSAASVTWTYAASGLPAGLSINSATGIISGTITASPSGTSDTVTVSASDGTGSASTTFDWTVVPVTLTAPADQASVGSTSISLALQADLASGYTATYSASGLPTGLSVNSSTGVISGTLDSGDTNNTYLVTVTATSSGVPSSQEFSWTVGTVVVAPLADQTNTEGDTVSLTVYAGTVSGTLSYSASGLPTGVTINSTTGVISGTLGAGTAVDGPWESWELGGGGSWDGPYEPGEEPSCGVSFFVDTGTATAGSYAVTVVASNGTVADSQTFNWTVNPKITVTALDDQQNVEGDSVSLAVTASDGSATLGYSATGLPNGLTINSSTGVISGTVATGDSSVGTYGVDVTVTDGTYSADVTFAWTIWHADDAAPVLTNPGTQTNVVGDNVNLALSASEADGDTLTYSATGLPDGLDIDSAGGVIFGTVAEDALQATPYAVTVTVDDGNGGVTTQTFNWIVNDSAMTVTAATLTASAGVDPETVTVATFTDTDPNWDPSEFTATITWGDGSSDEGEVDGSNGSYTVTDDHVYNRAGTYSVQVSVTDGFNTTNATGTATVNDSTLTMSGGVQEGAVASISVSGTWASFTDTNLTSSADSYSAVINWGDGSATTTGTVTGSDGAFVVSGSHAYANDGTDTVTVTITDQDGTTATVNSTAQVGDVFAGESATMTLASFTVADPTEPASAYTAIVSWGDGSATTTATVTGSAGLFTVQGTHTYAVDSVGSAGGTDTVTVTLVGPNETTLNSSGNQTLTATKAVAVERPPLTGYADEALATASVSFTNAEVATFTEPDVTDATSEFSATINWGDGTSSSGTVTGSNGLFHVLGSHSYSTAGAFEVQVAVSQNWETSSVVAVVQSLFTVLAQPGQVAPKQTPFTAAILDLIKKSGDTTLNPRNLASLINDYTVTGNDAAAAAVMQQYVFASPGAWTLFGKAADWDPNKGITAEDLKTYVTSFVTPTDPKNKDAAALEEIFAQTKIRLDSTLTSAEAKGGPLFPGGLPNASKITQGNAGDCSFLAATAALVYQNPAAFMKRFTQGVGTVLASGKTVWNYSVELNNTTTQAVRQPTDAQIALYASSPGNGLWLSVFETAYAQQRFKEKKDVNPFIPLNLTGYVGNSEGEPLKAPIETLTGNDAVTIRLGKNMNDGDKDQLKKYLNQFAAIKKSNRPIMLVGSSTNPNWSKDSTTKTNQLPGPHAFAVTDFDPDGKDGGTITLLNPWNVKEWTYGGTIVISYNEFIQMFSSMAVEIKK